MPARVVPATLAIWGLSFVLGVGATVALLGSALTSSGEITSDPESERGYALIGRHFPPDPQDEYVNELVLVRSDRFDVDDEPFRRKVEDIVDAAVTNGIAHSVRSFYDSRDSSLVSRDRDATVVPIGLAGDPEDSADRLVEVVQAAAGGDFEVAVSGEWTLDRDINRIVGEDLKTGELYFGLPAALCILILVFGALVAAIVPLVLAIFSIVVALGLSALVGQAFDLSVYLVQMLTVMGLAIATDYALFIVSRYREERARGRPEHTRSRRLAGARAGRCCSAASRSCWRCAGSSSSRTPFCAASESARSRWDSSRSPPR